MSGVIARLENVSKHYSAPGGWFRPARAMKAVDSVTLDFPRGAITGIVGESGCGKSTLARLLNGLVPTSGGRILFDGQDLATLPPGEMRRLRRRMQMVFQDPYSSIDPRFRIADAVLEPLKVQGLLPSPGETADRVAALLDQVGLAPGFASAYPHQLSGGQKQRVGIARALALRPELLVLDEPTASLDASIQAQIIALLEKLHGENGLTYAFISHDLGLVRYFCSRIVVMYLGAIMEILPDRNARPRHPYTAGLMASTFPPDPKRRREIRVMTGEIPSPFDRPPGCPFAARCERAAERCRREKPELDGTAGHPLACHYPLD